MSPAVAPSRILALVGVLALAACPAPADDDPFDTGDSDGTNGGGAYADDSDYVLNWADSDTEFPYDTGDTDALETDDTDTSETDELGCPTGYIEDCNGACFSSTLVADGFCDDGPAPTPDFACDEFPAEAADCPVDTDTDSDTGDTAVVDSDTDLPPPECTGFDVNDCNGACYPSLWVGDGHCDDGTRYPYGSPNFQCAAFDDDMGDCAPDTDVSDSDTDDSDSDSDGA